MMSRIHLNFKLWEDIVGNPGCKPWPRPWYKIRIDDLIGKFNIQLISNCSSTPATFYRIMNIQWFAGRSHSGAQMLGKQKKINEDASREGAWGIYNCIMIMIDKWIVSQSLLITKSLTHSNNIHRHSIFPFTINFITSNNSIDDFESRTKHSSPVLPFVRSFARSFYSFCSFFTVIIVIIASYWQITLAGTTQMKMYKFWTLHLRRRYWIVFFFVGGKLLFMFDVQPSRFLPLNRRLLPTPIRAQSHSLLNQNGNEINFTSFTRCTALALKCYKNWIELCVVVLSNAILHSQRKS